MIRLIKLLTGAILISIISIACSSGKLKVTIDIDPSEPQLHHAVKKLQEMALDHNIIITANSPDLIIHGEIDTLNLSKEAFNIRQEGADVWLSGGCAQGLTYALFHIKDKLEAGETKFENRSEQPHYSFRALKFNLPWSSYRRSEALNQHYETCRDTIFWESFLDMMLENRFNKLTLWNLHPFNYLVRTESYPEACGFTDEELAEWKQFWKSLFRMAKNRGIETYLVNWNIFVSPEFAEAHDVATYSITGEYFIEGDTASIIQDYTREAVRQVIDEYPDLTGLGITLGEAMFGMTAEQREKWLLDGFVQGMREASRKIKFIHRAPLTKGHNDNTTMGSVERITRKTLDTLSCVESPIIIELKYNWSHGHSSPRLFKVHGGKLTDAYWNPEPTNYKLAWMVRNEDFFMLRWGQADFIRQHIEMNSQSHVTGYFVGSETYIPADDYFTLLEKGDWEYAFERQWMFYKQWGRLLYNPDTPDSFFESNFELRYPGNGNALFESQSLVSRIPLIVASYWDATWDYSLYSEGMISIMGQETTQLLSLHQILKKVPMDTLLMGVQEYIDLEKQGLSRDWKIDPNEMADSIQDFCTRAIEMLESVDPGKNIDLLYERSDIETWANLGLYFAHKLRAALEYGRFLESEDNKNHRQAVSHLEEASTHWERVSELTVDLYKEVPLQHYNRNSDTYFHWTKVYKEVRDEMEWLKNLAD